MTRRKPPQMAHVEFASKDPVATRKFLERVFGWKFNVVPMGPIEYALHGDAEGALGAGIGVRGLERRERPGTIGYTLVSDVDATRKAIKRAGGKLLGPKLFLPGGGWAAVYLAPGGILQGLIQPA